MRVIFEKIFLWVLLCVFAMPVQAQQNTMRIAVFGDSLTSGYALQAEDAFPAKLERKLREVGYSNIEVLNMSADGESTSAAAERIGSVLVKRPDIVIVQLGSNDALRGINIDLIYTNLVNIIGRLLQQKSYVILMGAKIPPTKDAAYAQQFNAMYAKLADFYRLSFYPNTLEGIYGNPDLNLADGFHPNGKGIDLMVEGVYRLVDEGLRYKWEALNAQTEELNELNPNKGVSAPAPYYAEPQALPPSR